MRGAVPKRGLFVGAAIATALLLRDGKLEIVKW
jgi:hypothetical protein